MNTILNEISGLRHGVAWIPDHQNRNRYRVVTVEPDGSRTAYYFAAPIYNNVTRKLVDMRFFTDRATIYSTGSNAKITIGETIRMENAEGSCTLWLTNRATASTGHEFLCGKDRLYPTTNGIVIKSACTDGAPCTLSIEISKPFTEVRTNGKYFALMSEKFRPFVTISCIGTTDAAQNIISPARLTHQKLTDRKYILRIIPCSPLGQTVMVEANLYEPKLFQDTTVESKNSKANNAFGGIGFIGTTREYGEQWLYARPDFSKMPELSGKKILRAILHLPRLSRTTTELTATGVAARFFSFGSAWHNKIAEASPVSTPQIANRYLDLDLTSVLSDAHGRLFKGEGFILKPKKRDDGFSVIATGDNYFTPQILEIHYR